MTRKIFLLMMATCILIFSMTGCSSHSFAGEYENTNATISHNIVVPNGNSTFHVGTDFISGEATYNLNSNGTGTYTFTLNRNFDPVTDSSFNKVAAANNITANDITDYLSSIDYILCEGDITWEAVDGCLYISGTGYYKDKSNSTVTLNKQYELKGKTLMYLNGNSSGYIKIG